MIDLLARPLVPVAGPDDAATTYERFRPYLLDAGVTPLVVSVIEKAGGAPDKAGVEQREDHAAAAFDAFRDRAGTDGVAVDTELLYGTDVAGTIVDAARAHDATAIVFASRGGGRLANLLSGGVRSSLITNGEYPVVVLPDAE